MRVPFAITASCLLLCCVAAAQASYVYKAFENPGATVTRVFGLNGHGELVGADDSLPGRHAFLLNHGSHLVLDSSGYLERIPVLPAGSTTAGTSWAAILMTTATNTASFSGTIR